MAYRRKMSDYISEALLRAANLKAIDPALDLGNGLTIAAYESEIAATQARLDSYNAKLAHADAEGNAFRDSEKNLRTMNARMLAAVGVKYGKNSSEYEMAGGTRSSEINYRPAPKKPEE